MRKIKPGMEVRLLIRDHVQNSDDDKCVQALVYGRVHKVTDTDLTIDVWANEDPDEKREPGDGVETFTLMRESIVSVAVAEWSPL
jgi:hypothetical protein